MRLFAVIVPPMAILKEVSEVVAHARPATAAPQHRRGLRTRFGGGGGKVSDDVAAQELDLPEVAKMHLPLTQFGNVTLGDSVKLTAALRAEALKWSRPQLHLEGGTALEFPGDESVWAKLGGDVDGLKTIGRGVPQVVARLGFFVDRRQFRPWLSVATITDHTTAPVLEGVVQRLEAFRGASWTVDSISVMKGLPDEGPDAYELLEQLPLAED
jgi:2'-5' RNA ligase